MNPVPLQIGIVVLLIAFGGIYFGVRGSGFRTLDQKASSRVIQRTIRALGGLLVVCWMAAYSMSWGWKQPHAYIWAALMLAAVVDILRREYHWIRRRLTSLQQV